MLQLFASCLQFSQLHKWLNTTSIMIDDPLSGQPLTESLALPALCRKNQKYDQAPEANHNWSKSMDQPGCGNPLLFFPKHPIAQSPPPLDIRLNGHSLTEGLALQIRPSAQGGP